MKGKVKLRQDQAISDNMTPTLGRKYSDLNKAGKNSCKRDKKQWIETKCQEAEHAAAKSYARSIYKIVRDLTGSRPNTSIPVKILRQEQSFFLKRNKMLDGRTF